MFLTDPSLELRDARAQLVAPFKIWDWVAVATTEPCFIVLTDHDDLRGVLSSTALVSSAESLVRYTDQLHPSICKVYLLEHEPDEKGSHRLQFREIAGLARYQAEPADFQYYAHVSRDGTARQMYPAQPPITDKTRIEMLVSFSGKTGLDAAPLN